MDSGLEMRRVVVCHTTSTADRATGGHPYNSKCKAQMWRYLDHDVTGPLTPLGKRPQQDGVYPSLALAPPDGIARAPARPSFLPSVPTSKQPDGPFRLPHPVLTGPSDLVHSLADEAEASDRRGRASGWCSMAFRIEIHRCRRGLCHARTRARSGADRAAPGAPARPDLAVTGATRVPPGRVPSGWVVALAPDQAGPA